MICFELNRNLMRWTHAQTRVFRCQYVVSGKSVLDFTAGVPMQRPVGFVCSCYHVHWRCVIWDIVLVHITKKTEDLYSNCPWGQFIGTSMNWPVSQILSTKTNRDDDEKLLYVVVAYVFDTVFAGEINEFLKGVKHGIATLDNVMLN